MRPDQAEKKYIKILRKMSGNQRVKIGADLYELAYKIVEASILEKFPHISKKELSEKIKERMS